MKRIFLLALAGLLLGQDRQFQLKPGPEARMTLEVYKTGLLSGKMHRFEFPSLSGRVEAPAGEWTRGRVELSVEAGRLLLKDDWLSEKDARKVSEYARAEMLDAARHPLVTFRSDSVEMLAGGGLRVHGQLAIRGVARRVAAELEPPSGQMPVFRGTARFRLTDFGLKPPSAALGAIGTKDEVLLRFELPAAAAP